VRLLSRPDADRSWALVATALRICAEAGFFATLYAALAVVLEGSVPLLGPIEFVLLVGLGAVVGYFGQDRPELGAPALIIAVLGGGIACWLASPIARGLLQDHFGAAVITHGIGWVGAFAVLRGSLIRGGESGAFQLEQLLRSLLPFVAVLWAITTIFVQRPLWPSFVAYALAGTLALIVAGLAGIGLVRLRVLHAGVQETRIRRLWRWLVLAAAISVVPLSVPFAILSGVPVDVLLQPLAGPVMLLLGLIIIPLGLLIDFLVVLLTPVAAGLAKFLDELRDRITNRGRPQFDPVEPSLVTNLLGIAIAAVVVSVIVTAIYLLARWLLSRQSDTEPPPDEVEGVVEHSIVIPTADPPRPRTAARRRRGAAHDAVTAYVSAVEALAPHPDWVRAASETPAEHSLRVRAADMPGSADFSRLAADYQLARYAERSITPREDRRALSRLERLRHLLRSR
jgi:hypothetical protein